MSFPRKLFPLALRSLAAASILAGYTAVGTAVDRPLRILRVVNGTNADVIISFNGVTDHMVVLAGQVAQLNMTNNKVREDGFFIGQGTQFFVKRAVGAATTGSLFIECYGGTPGTQG